MLILSLFDQLDWRRHAGLLLQQWRRRFSSSSACCRRERPVSAIVMKRTITGSRSTTCSMASGFRHGAYSERTAGFTLTSQQVQTLKSILRMLLLISAARALADCHFLSCVPCLNQWVSHPVSQEQYQHRFPFVRRLKYFLRHSATELTPVDTAQHTTLSFYLFGLTGSTLLSSPLGATFTCYLQRVQRRRRRCFCPCLACRTTSRR